jgi:hypothetical protein
MWRVAWVRLPPAGFHRGAAALQRIRNRAKKRQLGRFDCAEWKPCRDEGRP